MKIKHTSLAIVLIVLAAISRLLPHPPNVTPIAAIAIFGSFYFSKKWMVYMIPLLTLVFSDFIINNSISRAFYPNIEGIVWFSPNMIWVYTGFILIITLSKQFLIKLNIKNLFVTTILASLVFFLLTNFGSWMHFGFYPKSIAGLLSCYIAGIPFFLNSILGNLFFVSIMFGAVYLIDSKIARTLA